MKDDLRLRLARELDGQGSPARFKSRNNFQTRLIFVKDSSKFALSLLLIAMASIAFSFGWYWVENGKLTVEKTKLTAERRINEMRFINVLENGATNSPAVRALAGQHRPQAVYNHTIRIAPTPATTAPTLSPASAPTIPAISGTGEVPAFTVQVEER